MFIVILDQAQFLRAALARLVVGPWDDQCQVIPFVLYI